MTKKTFDGLIATIERGTLFDYIYRTEVAQELTKEELLTITREFADAMYEYRYGTAKQVTEKFIANLKDAFEPFGFDDEE